MEGRGLEQLRPFLSPLLTEGRGKQAFSEVRRSKRPAEFGGKHPTTALRGTFGVQKRPPGSIRCTFM
jgi:hypothetical protein